MFPNYLNYRFDSGHICEANLKAADEINRLLRIPRFSLTVKLKTLVAVDLIGSSVLAKSNITPEFKVEITPRSISVELL